MQLRLAALAAALGAVLAAAPASAQEGDIDAYSTVFYEFGGPLYNLVIDPHVGASVDPVPELGIQVAWDADIVSGASVAVVDAPSPDPDVITSATKYDELRNVFSGGVELRGRYASLRGTYAYGFESDYRSHSFTVGARAELFERNTVFDLSYGRGFDQVCNLAQPDNQEPVERQALPGSEGCFSDDPTRVALDVSLHTAQGSWTQAWAPVFTTQLTVTTQLVDGFQSNPYRSVWLGRSAAQENHPRERWRYAAGLGTRLWLEPLSAALRLNARVYRDSWDVRSITAELGYEQALGDDLRLLLRGRYYHQGQAIFFSDNYAVLPRGQFFTGDRELADMRSVLVGLRLLWTIFPNDGAGAGPLAELRVLLKGDWLHHAFPNFRYGQAPVPNNNAVVGTLGLELLFR
ncbi:MAG: DUF3570 domain-containing protein [Sandaracinaceae bacterium]